MNFRHCIKLVKTKLGLVRVVEDNPAILPVVTPEHSLDYLIMNQPEKALCKVLAGEYSAAEVNKTDHYAITPLQSAIYSQNIPLCMALIAAGADVFHVDAGEQSNLLHISASCNANHEVRDFLIECGVSLDAKNHRGETPLELAIRKHSKAFMKSPSGDFAKAIEAVAELPPTDAECCVPLIGADECVSEDPPE